MGYELYSKMRLITDRYEGWGVPKGTIGIILEQYKNGNYEMQFLFEKEDIVFDVEEEEITKIE